MTDEQYHSSALLVNWLCKVYNLPRDRNHILGHSELVDEDGKSLSSHRDCPQGVLSWERFMQELLKDENKASMQNMKYE